MESGDGADEDGLRVVAGVDPADLADDHLARILEEVGDRSDGSDALAARVVGADPHLGATRSALLVPVRIRPDARAAVLGCGAGAIARALADRGAVVAAVEPSLAMARLARARCRGTERVEVVAGSVRAWAETEPGASFDLVVVAPLGSGVLAGPASMAPGDLLAIGAALLRPGGVVVLAVDNPLGTAGLSGQRMPVLAAVDQAAADLRAAAAWQLTIADGRRLLDELGLEQQAWFGVQPDLVAPRTILAADLVTTDEGRRLAEAFVRDPSRASMADPAPWADPRRAARAALEAGLGLTLASSLLVVAGRSEEAVASAVRPGRLFALPGPLKGARWRRTRVLDGAPGAWMLGPLDGIPAAEVVDGSLRLREVPEPVVIGRNAEDLVVDAIGAEGIDGPGATALLRAWWRAASAIAGEPDDGGWQFDLAPRNFLVDEAGAWRFVDRELTLLDRPAPTTIAWRALFFLVADRLLAMGPPPGLPADLTVRELTTRLLEHIGVPVADGDEERWIALESDIQDRTRPGVASAAAEADALWVVGGWRLDHARSATPQGRLEVLAGEMATLRGQLAAVTREREAAQADAAAARARTEAAQADAAAARARIEAALAATTAAEERATSATTRYWETQRLHSEAEARARVAEDALLRLAEATRRGPGSATTEAAPPEPARRSLGRLGDRLAQPLGAATRRVGRASTDDEVPDGLDVAWYLARYPDVAASGMDAGRHWRRHGVRERRDPGPWFDTRWYLETYRDVATAGEDPLLHYARHGRSEGRHPYRPAMAGDPPPDHLTDTASGARLLAVYELDQSVVEEAVVRYPGHRPPVRPAALPSDPATPSAIAAQARRARAYGIDGFSFRSAWGSPATDETLRWLARPDAVVGSFAIGWSDPRPDDRRDVALSILRALASPRSLRMDGAPVLLLDDELEEDVVTAAPTIRSLARAHGLPVPRVLLVSERPPRGDALRAVDGWLRAQPRRDLLDGLDRQVMTPGDAVIVVDHATTWPLLAHQSDGPDPLPIVLAGWDDTRVATEGTRPIVIDHVLADGYRRWLTTELDRTATAGTDRFVLIDGWNRWAVGASLVRDPGSEPDLLQATRAARSRAPEGPVTP